MQNFIGELKLNDSSIDIVYRPLQSQDIPSIIDLGAKCFAYNNTPFSLMINGFEDALNFMESSDYEKILKQGMAVGAFLQNKLIAYAIGCDLSIKVLQPNYIPTSGAQNIFNTMKLLSSEYLQKDYKIGECFFLYLLVSQSDLNKKNIATQCFNLVCQQAQKNGFKKFVVQAWHPGTKRITEKNFIKTKIETEITQYEGKQINLWAISSEFF